MIVPLLGPASTLPPPDPAVLGGKGAGLARLMGLDLPVPPAVVVPVADRGRIVDPDDHLGRLPEPYAVRSSAPAEDAGDRSAAGQYESLNGVLRDSLHEAVRTVHASAGSDRVRDYRGDTDAEMAVVVQRDVPADRAGVAFSRDPLTGEDAVVIECVFGHGERLVSGLVAPDRFVVDAAGHIRARIGDRESGVDANDERHRVRRTIRTLRDDEVLAVADLARRAEAGFGVPVDIEFCTELRTIWLVQCRPITTSGGRA